MAILIAGKTICPICGDVIGGEQKSVSFPPFIANELDPLILFSDAAFHEECFNQHPFADKAISLRKEMDTKSHSSNRQCIVCTQSLNDPDDYITFGHLTSDEADPLFYYNYAQLHRSCLARWSDRAHVKHLLQDLNGSKRWKGASLKWVLDRL